MIVEPFHYIVICVFAVALLGAITCVGCGSPTADATPVQVLSEFLEAMDRSANDVDALQEAYNLLDIRARRALKKRAMTAATLAGREFKPWEMLAQGRFRIVFSPARRGGMRAKISGDRATVIVKGSERAQRVEVPMVREKDGWRVELKIPEIQYTTESTL